MRMHSRSKLMVKNGGTRLVKILRRFFTPQGQRFGNTAPTLTLIKFGFIEETIIPKLTMTAIPKVESSLD